MDVCSDASNSTDCLLQSILDMTKEHNKWDVPTFYTTVLIGVVAAGFALVGIIQNLLSASLGHQKCSRYAIGHWHKKSRHRLNWAELHWDSIAYTPVLTSRAIQNKHINKDRARPGGRFKYLRCYGFWKCLRLTRSHKDHRAGDRYFPATWLHLLTSIDIDQFVWDNFQKDAKRTVADYLPPEYQAVPAYMDMDTIIALAAEAGCDVLAMEPKSRYPIISGSSIQVGFRQDSFLGLVASFESYTSKEDSEVEATRDIKSEATETIHPAIERLRANLDSARGNFESVLTKPDGSPGTRQVNVLDSESGPGLSQSGAEPLTDGQAIIIDFRGDSISSQTDKGCHEDRFTMSQLCSCQTLLQELKKRHDFSWLFNAMPTDARKMETFPAKSAKIKQILGAVVVQGSFWSKDHSKLRKEYRRKRNSDDKPVLMEIFALCLDFACDAATGKQKFSRYPSTWKRQLREAIMDQMREVDDTIRVLDAKAEKTSGCTQIEIYIMSATLMRPELCEGPMIKEIYKSLSSYVPSSSIVSKAKLSAKDILRLLKDANDKQGPSLVQVYSLFVKLFDDSCATEVDILLKSLFALADSVASRESMASVDEKNLNDQDQDQEWTLIGLLKGQKEAKLELLIYRTVLLSIICLTALDSSEVLEAGIGTQIVPFL